MQRKVIVTQRKERNHFVVPALMRKAGAHRKSNKALRRAQNQQPMGVWRSGSALDS